MTFHRRTIAIDALSKALRLRNEHGLPLDNGIELFDLVQAVGVRLVFLDLPSMEGMYSPEFGPAIFICAQRPFGRQAFTCAHELGHHVYGHPSNLDQWQDENYVSRAKSPEEHAADMFAAFLLMPKLAVSHGFAGRGFDVRTCTPLQVYIVATWLGVGYATLVLHLERTLRLISKDHATKLAKVQPKQIKQRLCELNPSRVVVLDPLWAERPLELSVGDILMLPKGAVLEGTVLAPIAEQEHYLVFQAQFQGYGRVERPANGLANYIRVTRLNYVGHSEYRFLPEPRSSGKALLAQSA